MLLPCSAENRRASQELACHMTGMEIGSDDEGQEAAYLRDFFPATAAGFNGDCGKIKAVQVSDFQDSHRRQHLEAFRRSWEQWESYEARQAVSGAAVEFARRLAAAAPQTQREFAGAERQLRREFRVAPSKAELLAACEAAGETSLLRFLRKKAVRTHSGVVVITVLTSPGEFSCEFDCHYCPNEPGQPRSYLSSEPAVLRANQNGWDCALQFWSRAETLLRNGHTIDKIEVLVLGGTWSGYPRAYQERFCRDLFYAANTFFDYVEEKKGNGTGAGTPAAPTSGGGSSSVPAAASAPAGSEFGNSAETPGAPAANGGTQSRCGAVDQTSRSAFSNDEELSPKVSVAAAAGGCDHSSCGGGNEHLCTVSTSGKSGVVSGLRRALPRPPTNMRPRLSLAEEQKINETATCKIIGLTLETRPDKINARELRSLRRLGCTRVQLGIQHTDDGILVGVNRRHTRQDAAKALRLLKNACFKVDIHLMPDLPGATVGADAAMFEAALTDPALQADQWKIYPCEVTPYSQIERWYAEGKYVPYTEKSPDLLTRLLLAAKLAVHPWLRLNRVVRDIPNPSIIAGNANTNLRQLLLDTLARNKLACRCLRCREVKDVKIDPAAKAILTIRLYPGQGGLEFFLSFETEDESILFAFLRLRIVIGDKLSKTLIEDEKGGPRETRKETRKSDEAAGGGHLSFPELESAGLIRELHVYGRLVGSAERKSSPTDLRPQHSGLGQRLLLVAEAVTAAFGLRKMAVIAGVGTREYYRTRAGYEIEGHFMTKLIVLDVVERRLREASIQRIPIQLYSLHTDLARGNLNSLLHAPLAAEVSTSKVNALGGTESTLAASAAHLTVSKCVRRFDCLRADGTVINLEFYFLITEAEAAVNFNAMAMSIDDRSLPSCSAMVRGKSADPGQTSKWMWWLLPRWLVSGRSAAAFTLALGFVAGCLGGVMWFNNWQRRRLK